MRRVLVTGSRHWTDRKAVFGALAKEWQIDPDIIVVHGHNPNGADALADEWAHLGLVRWERHPADWEKYGKRAGPLRNQEMVDLGADVCLAFPLPDGKGTQDMMRRARKAGIPVIEFQEKEMS